MYIKLSASLCFCLFVLIGSTQIMENFSGGELSSNPQWFGDLQDFIINDDNELQLFADEAGESFIYTNISLGNPQLWEAYFRMDFSPSNSNFCRIYLGLDDIDLSNASGYYIECGASGSEDAIELYQLINGNKTLLASGTLGSIATDPSMARIQLSYTNDNTISLMADFAGGTNYQTEFTESFNLDLSQMKYFGIYAKYTSTRVDKCFFDDINIPDFSPPALNKIEIIDVQTLTLDFNEDLIGAEIDQFNISPTLNISSVTFDDGEPQKVTLNLSDNIKSGVEYTLDIFSIQDKLGNIANDISQTFIFVSTPQLGDLKVSEILFDPFIGGEDFIEIYNNSEQILSLENIFLANLDKEEEVLINDPMLIKPGEYLAFTGQLDFLANNYQLLTPENVYEQSIPSFNNTDGNFSIVLKQDGESIILDSFYYSEDLHFELLSDTEGVSLERLNFDESSDNLSNWHSASAAAGFATPGYENSNRFEAANIEGIFSLQSTTFSPNGDSEDDLLILNYQTMKAGFIADIDIFDAYGRPVKKLERSLLLSVNGFVQWDGINNEGNRERVGVYILYISGFHPDGDKIEQKLAFTLADFLD